MKNRKAKRDILLVCSVLLLGLLCLKTKEESVPEPSKPPEEESGSGIFLETDGGQLRIKAWLNEENNKYYFFLPDFLNKDRQWEMGGGQEEPDAETIALSDIPAIFITLETGTLDGIRESKENKEDMRLSLFARDAKENKKELKGTIKARGNASFHAPKYKKSYTIKLAEEAELSGLPKGGEWVLLAHYYDDTHLRDYLTFDMARTLNMAYVPEGKLVNLYIEDEFQGIYFLCEKIEITPGKIAITNLEQETWEKIPAGALAKYPYAREGMRGGQNVVVEKGFAAGGDSSDITGGYLLELEWLKDRYDEEKSGFTSDANQCVVIKSPEYATGSQVSYIKERYQLLEDSIKRSAETDSDEFLTYLDLDSFVSKYLVEEVSKNMDANMSSQYLYKDRDTVDSRFYAGPPWDYDRAYDNKVGDVNNRGAAMFWVNKGSAGFDFWKNLYNTGVFRKRVREVYEEKISSKLSEYADKKLWEWEAEVHDSIVADMFRYRSEYQEKMDEEERLSKEMEALAEFIRERKVFLDGEWVGN